ncbi:MAG: cation transporting ATPase C-terminal domain-containing protein, partial [Clostridia bacterium]|nr:cation transporting ATPase C-terminal domain-containing protein [Clostridia bacterium]
EPVHLLWINLVTDTFPALALGMEKAEDDVMKQPPRSSKAGVFSNGMGVDILYQGILVALLVMGSFFIGYYLLAPSPILAQSHGMTMAFLTMSMAEIFHSMNMRSQRGSLFKVKSNNNVLWLAAVGTFVLTTLVCEVPFLASAFGFATVGWLEYGVAMLMGVLIIPIVELVKFFQRLYARKKQK